VARVADIAAAKQALRAAGPAALVGLELRCNAA
jgi:hypothetical protein